LTKLPSTPTRDKVRAFAPKLMELTETIAYDDIWEREQLSKRDRSLITVAALVALDRPGQLASHIERALGNGLTKEELGEIITHVGFYGGFPLSEAGALVLDEILDRTKK